MTNKEIRDKNNTLPATKRTTGQTERYMIAAALRKRLAEPGKLEEYVNAQLVAAIEDRNVSAQVEINNRVDGKIKNEIKIDISISEHIPDQIERKDIQQLYRREPKLEDKPADSTDDLSIVDIVSNGNDLG